MPKSLYEVLGVTKDASAEAIKKAVRHKRAKAHPDKKGGEETEAIRDINRAAKVLLLPHLREKYDRDGTENVKPERPIDTDARECLLSVLTQRMHQVPDNIDLIESLRQAVFGLHGKFAEQVTGAQKAIFKLQRQAKRFKVKKGRKPATSYLFSAFYEQQIGKTQEQLDNATRLKQVTERALEILLDFEFAPDSDAATEFRSFFVEWGTR